MAAKKTLKDRVLLRGFDKDANLVFKRTISWVAYYDQNLRAIDSSEARAEKGIRRLIVALFNSTGRLVQAATCVYDVRGAMTERTAVHDTGDVNYRLTKAKPKRQIKPKGPAR